MRNIKGAGGGGNTQARQSIVADDSLQSSDSVRILSVISEGEIEGFPSDSFKKDIFLDDTPLQNADGTENFRSSDIQFRLGLPNQTALSGFNTTEQLAAEGVLIRADSPATRSITNADADSARLIISTDLLQRINPDNGDITKTSVSFNIQISSNDGPFTTITTDTFFGKTSGGYRRQYEFPLIGTAPWSVRVNRLTADSQDANLADKIFYDRLFEIKNSTNGFDNTAIVGAIFPADEFRSVPKIGLRLLGTKIQVPDNYDAQARTYTGIFDGSLKTAYSNNPAWVLYDWLSNERYGLGLPTNALDVYSFYSAGLYCDEQVSDGLQGTEPRYTFNEYIQNKGDFLDITLAIMSSFNANFYLEGGSIVLTVDRPKNSEWLFTAANVVCEYDEEGKLTSPPFEYSNSPTAAKYNSILVSWEDPASNFATQTELIEDFVDIEKYGHNPTEIVSFGCTSRGQVTRIGRGELFTSLYADRAITFRVARDGVFVKPGDIISVSDISQNSKRLAGRVIAKTETTIQLDQSFAFEEDVDYQISLLNSTGGLSTNFYTPDEDTDTDTLTLSTDALVGTVWGISYEDTKPVDFRVLSVDSEEDIFVIQGTLYVDSKYAFIENFTLATNSLGIENFLGKPNPPRNLEFNESLFKNIISNIVQNKTTVIWSTPLDTRGISGYEVFYSDGVNSLTDSTIENFIDLVDLSPGAYTFQVRTVNNLGQRSQLVSIGANILGLTKKPDDANNFQLVQNSRDTLTLSWDKSLDLDVVNNGTAQIRHNRNASDNAWGASHTLKSLSGDSTNVEIAYLPGTYSIKFIDSTGNYSANAKFVNTSYTEQRNLNFIETITESPAFAGNKQLVELDSDSNLELAKANTVDNYLGNIDDIVQDWDTFFEMMEASVLPAGTYTFKNKIDLGSVQSVRLHIDIASNKFTEAITIDDWLSSVDELVDIDSLGSLEEGSDIKPQIKVDDGVWSDFFEGLYFGREFEFRILFTSELLAANTKVSFLKVFADMEDKDAVGSGTSLTSADLTVTFSDTFYVVPNIQVSIYEAQDGDRVQIVSRSTSGFTINIRNGSDRVARQFGYFAKGY